ncbi:MAG: type I-U CRISPR-associated protein Cas5/Cas6 [Synechococcus sp. SB0662_bin_45]|uniref:Type I-U CRISPR-associated protein Cas5/Cas6 n=1 Tax=Synechococcus sp. SB0676_bin_10 TaxID=2604869 RepID=A0A6B1F820_9SYNE|nr:type I-U CRISPR-associated protein Cas5/Cas6 [Synechococcus sp. SB0668_bin_13]MYE21998.1 type I-U CRISPR-associated protein Cas5/Cas6 [Synechococcus sp. SB0662_bin_45]MYG37926.1 type I-U CRISPR-associated protein Cas5/Cas6 [Synechococcus sp. SB0676_bin_10]MYG64897.1 type I-U CRISPR-associated protein Cas5/Cas6 [Synechococcus sp. SB0675_bin_7]MYK85385.1 type I-U CRISPR-associated protein Cas5/Cas6 [Synechococcus sp. SB0669_bin_7]
MFTVSVEFLHGTFRADPDGTANTGQLRHGEWPPSVSRLFAALVAADGTRERCRVTDGSELEWFEHLPPPAIHAAQQIHHQPLCDRYVVKNAKGPAQKTHQEYVAREGAMSRPGVRIALCQPRVVYRWDVASPSAATLQALRRRAARVGYLGTSDSPVRVRIATQVPSDCPEQVFVPDQRGDAVISVARPGDIQTLDRMYDQWCERGAAVARLQFPSLRHNVAYRSPGATPPDDRGEVVAWLRLGTPVSGRRISALTQCFKEAVLSQHQRIHGDSPAVLHGHGCGSHGYEIARYCPLPDVGCKYSRGRIYGLALWMPPGSDGATRRQARDAARSIRHLRGRGIDVAVAPRDEDERRPFAAHPERWTCQARHWATAFPAIYERRRTLDLPEITLWCQHAGLPEPVAFCSSRTPLVTGALDLAPVEVNRPGRPGLPYSHVELWFAEPVAGPVVIGSGRQRGFGLCVPCDREDAAR